MLRMAITDRRIFGADWQAGLLARCRALAADGVDLLLIREKDLPAGELATLARQIREGVSGSAMRVLIASRPDLALVCGLAGVHLSTHPSELAPDQVRQVFDSHHRPYVTASCHSEVEVCAAREHGVDAILFAPVFGKRVSGRLVVEAAGLRALSRACALAGPVPVLALGGVTAANAPECVAAGAAGIAGIRLFFGDPDSSIGPDAP